MRARIKYSQNFLKDQSLVSKLVSMSSLSIEDMVYEIGAGQGIITQELLKRSKRVIAFEIDENLYQKLKFRFQTAGNKLELLQQDFLNARVPNYKYKVFSNVPFNITSEVVKKLVFAENSPEDTYLIMQKEAAMKFVGKPLVDKNSLMSILIKAKFELSAFYTFRKTDFVPMPAVETVMVRIKKSDVLAVPESSINMFYDFVTFGFNQFEPDILNGLGKLMSKSLIVEEAKSQRFAPTLKPSQLSFENWVALFNKFMLFGNKTKVAGSYKVMLLQQTKLQKSHRTRKDKNWREFVKQ